MSCFLMREETLRTDMDEKWGLQEREKAQAGTGKEGAMEGAMEEGKASTETEAKTAAETSAAPVEGQKSAAS